MRDVRNVPEGDIAPDVARLEVACLQLAAEHAAWEQQIPQAA
jgi:hypothetical protein